MNVISTENRLDDYRSPQPLVVEQNPKNEYERLKQEALKNRRATYLIFLAVTATSILTVYFKITALGYAVVLLLCLLRSYDSKRRRSDERLEKYIEATFARLLQTNTQINADLNRLTAQLPTS